jgi:hypothetical protein
MLGLGVGLDSSCTDFSVEVGSDSDSSTDYEHVSQTERLSG